MAIEIHDGGLTLTGEHLNLFALISLAHGLALEINTGMKMSRGGSPMLAAKAQCGSHKNTKKGVLRDYVAWLSASTSPAWEPSPSIVKAMAK